MHTQTEAGFIIDTETGEIITDTLTPPDFVVNDQESLEWAMRRRLEITTAIDAKNRFYETIVAQGEKEINRLNKQLDWWEYRFGTDVEHYTRQQLEGKKVRYLSTPYGEATLRRINSPSICIHDKPELTHWLKSNRPETTKSSSVTVIDMSILREGIESGEITPPADFVTVIPPHDKFSIRLPKISEKEQK